MPNSVQAAGDHHDWGLPENLHWVDQMVDQLVTEAFMVDIRIQVAIVVSSDAKLAEPSGPISNSQAGQQMLGSTRDAFLRFQKVCISRITLYRKADMHMNMYWNSAANRDPSAQPLVAFMIY